MTQYSDGVLQAIHEHGIVTSLSFAEGEPQAPNVFYPWGAVLSIQLTGE